MSGLTCRRVVPVAALAFVFALVCVGTAEAGIVTDNLLYHWDASDGTNATAATWTSPIGTTQPVWTINDGTTQRVLRQAVLSSTTMTGAYDFTGWVNNVANANGTATRDAFGNNESDVTGNTASFEFWIKPDNLTTSHQMIFETGGVNRGFSLSLWGNELKLGIKTGQDGYQDPPDILTHTLSPADITDFLQVVITVEDSTDQASLYVNPLSESAPSTAKASTGAGGWWGTDCLGTSDSSLGGKNAAGTSAPELGGGSSQSGDTWYGNSTNFVGYEGQTGIVRVYNDILTGSEVEDNFDAVKAASSGTLKFWRGDGGAGYEVGWQNDNNWFADLAGSDSSATRALSGDVVVLHTTNSASTRYDIIQINNHLHTLTDVRGFLVLPGATFDSTMKESLVGTFEVREGSGSTEGTLTLTDAVAIDFRSDGTQTGRTLDFRADNADSNRNDYNLAFSNAAGAVIDVEGATDRLKISFDIVNATPTNAATITKTGAGTLELYGPRANTYSGNWVVEGGTLELNKTAGLNAIVGNLTVGDGIGTDTVKLLKANQIANTSDVTVNAGGVFDLNGNGDTIDALSGAGTVDNTGASAATLTVGSAGGGGTFSGTIQDTGAGALALTKLGVGALTLSGDNTYSGKTTIGNGLASNRGTIRLGGDPVGTVGSITSSPIGTGILEFQAGYLSSDGTTDRVILNDVRFEAGDGNSAYLGNAANNGLLTFKGSGTLTGNRGLETYSDVVFEGDIGEETDTGNLNKRGPATLTLNGNNTYTGVTDIDAGTLLVNGTHTGGSTYTVASGATLGGSGTTDATVIIESGGILSPGESTGAFGVGAVTLETGSTLDIEINDYGDFDVLNVIGTATLGGTLVLHTPPGFDPPFCTEFVVLTAAELLGEFDEFDTSNVNFASPAMGWEVLYDRTPDAAKVTLHVVPEPISFTLLALGGLGLLVRRRKRR